MFTDIHGSANAMKSVENKIKRYNPELVICAGDISIFSNYVELLLYQMNTWNKKILMLHGNHEDAKEMRLLCKDLNNIYFLHKKLFRLNGFVFFGYGGGGFSLTDKQFEKFSRKIMEKKKKNEKLIFVTHGPPYGTVIDRIYEEHCGNKSYTKFINRYKPIIAISGHLHENNNKKQIYKKTLIVNPGPNGIIINTDNVINKMLK